MNPTAKSKAGWNAMISFKADASQKALMERASGVYMGPVWGYDDTFDSAFDLGFMAGWKAARTGRVQAPWENGQADTGTSSGKGKDDGNNA